MTWPNWPLKLRTSSSHEEGVSRTWSVSTKSFEGDGKDLKSLILKKVEWEKDSNNNMTLKESKGPKSEITLKADWYFSQWVFFIQKRQTIKKLRVRT